MALEAPDIEEIEMGNANIVYRQKFGFYHRLYETLWQLQHCSRGLDPSGQSISKRIESYKIALYLMDKYFWTGVGTGDVIDTYHKAFAELKPEITYEGRVKGANQFISFFIKLGIFGLLTILFALVFPIFYERKHTHLLFNLFLLLIFLSLLTEDTFNYQVGANFFAFFYSLWVYGFDRNDTQKIKPPEYLGKIIDNHLFKNHIR
jgi:O-antigen ligase